MTLAAEAWVPLAEIARPHGVRGELRLRLFNRDSDPLRLMQSNCQGNQTQALVKITCLQNIEGDVDHSLPRGHCRISASSWKLEEPPSQSEAPLCLVGSWDFRSKMD